MITIAITYVPSGHTSLADEEMVYEGFQYHCYVKMGNYLDLLDLMVHVHAVDTVYHAM
jgi:hypothetical protein